MNDSFDTAKVKPFAPWWTMFLARIFGEKWTSKEGTCVMTGYHWRGIIYVWSVHFEEMRAISGSKSEGRKE